MPDTSLPVQRFAKQPNPPDYSVCVRLIVFRRFETTNGMFRMDTLFPECPRWYTGARWKS
jgi:hypothetical protein